ncbi:MAG: NAD-dependent epimerase/dehydratase family protein [Acidobacteria bacterium]|nr:NAD-dependent epimerase/dehydratase family protein [Acidobacteriota bacterium]
MQADPLVGPDGITAYLERLEQPVAVTGGTGFVGSHLVDTLCAAGIRPRVLVRDRRSPRWIADRPVELVHGSLGDSGSLRRLVESARTVFHLAGVLRAAHEADFDRGNREGTENLLEAVAGVASEATVVHVSSLAAAGPSPEIGGVGPEVEPSPLSAYGRSKLAAERAVQQLGGEGRWIILRPPAIYGPRDTDVLQFFRLAARGLVPLPSGERWVTVAYVADVVRGILAAAAGVAPLRAIYHLGEPVPYRMPALIHLLAAAGGVRARVVPVLPAIVALAGAAGSSLQRLGFSRVAMTRDKARELTARHWTARTSDSLRQLGLEHWVDFPTGATRTWEWYRVVGWVR